MVTVGHETLAATKVTEEVTARMPTRTERRLLQLDDGTPVIDLIRHLHDADVSKGSREVWVDNSRTGKRERRSRTRFYARYRVDGFDFRVSFEQKGGAEAFAQQLEEGYARGWLFDPTPAGSSTPPRAGSPTPPPSWST
ncbi:hypothetical protein BH23ACT9_BH23ACT9_24990 [soil metagenome]